MRKSRALKFILSFFISKHDKDFLNLMEHRLTGCSLKLKKGVLPSLFDCQPDRRTAHSSKERPVIIKRRRIEIIESCLKTTDDDKLYTRKLNMGRRFSKSGRLTLSSPRRKNRGENLAHWRKRMKNNTAENSSQLPPLAGVRIKQEIIEVWEEKEESEQSESDNLPSIAEAKIKEEIVEEHNESIQPTLKLAGETNTAESKKSFLNDQDVPRCSRSIVDACLGENSDTLSNNVRLKEPEIRNASPPCKQPLKKRRGNNDDNELSKDVLTAVQEHCFTRLNPEEDLSDILGKTVAMKHRNLPSEDQKLMAERLIHEVLLAAELGKLTYSHRIAEFPAIPQRSSCFPSSRPS